MTDNRTTELRISEPLRGFIRHQSNRAYIDGGQARWLTQIADDIDAKHEQAVAAWNTRADRTCRIEDRYYDELWDAVCTRLSCGHDVWSDPPKFCPECGARVIA